MAVIKSVCCVVWKLIWIMNVIVLIMSPSQQSVSPSYWTRTSTAECHRPRRLQTNTSRRSPRDTGWRHWCGSAAPHLQPGGQTTAQSDLFVTMASYRNRHAGRILVICWSVSAASSVTHTHTHTHTHVQSSCSVRLKVELSQRLWPEKGLVWYSWQIPVSPC